MLEGHPVWVKPQEYKKLGYLLAMAREEALLTQEDVAGRLRKPRSFVSNYENGQRRIDVLELVQICAAVKMDPVKLFTQLVRSI
jgi:transcriptional regulator with XRE-family HTH domain